MGSRTLSPLTLAGVAATALVVAATACGMPESAPTVAAGSTVSIGTDHRLLCTVTTFIRSADDSPLGISAGHCGNVGDEVRFSDAALGTVVAKSIDPDILLFDVDRDHRESVDHDDHDLGAAVIGDTVCAGIGVDDSCGEALRVANGRMIASLCTYPGDSGAPVYRGRELVGLVQGAVSLSGDVVPCDQATRMKPASNTSVYALTESALGTVTTRTGVSLPTLALY